MSKTEPQLFRFKPPKMLADPTYQSPRTGEKSQWLRDLEMRQAGKLPAKVTPIHSSKR